MIQQNEVKWNTQHKKKHIALTDISRYQSRSGLYIQFFPTLSNILPDFTFYKSVVTIKFGKRENASKTVKEAFKNTRIKVPRVVRTYRG